MEATYRIFKATGQNDVLDKFEVLVTQLGLRLGGAFRSNSTRSCRAYTSETPLTREQLDALSHKSQDLGLEYEVMILD